MVRSPRHFRRVFRTIATAAPESEMQDAISTLLARALGGGVVRELKHLTIHQRFTFTFIVTSEGHFPLGARWRNLRSPTSDNMFCFDGDASISDVGIRLGVFTYPLYC